MALKQNIITIHIPPNLEVESDAVFTSDDDFATSSDDFATSSDEEENADCDIQHENIFIVKVKAKSYKEALRILLDRGIEIIS